MRDNDVVIAVLGLGEAGGAISADLVKAGITVRGYDPAVTPPDGVTGARNEADAASRADLVLSLNSSAACVDAMRSGLDELPSAGVWADLNTTSPGTKQQLAAIAHRHRTRFADIAIMAPVPGRGLGVPMLISGTGADSVARILCPLGASINTMDDEAGAAATRKLLRSVFFKGMAAAIVEALQAARAAGCEDWLHNNIVNELDNADSSTVDQIVTGTHQHAARRTDEMAAATHMLTELGINPAIAAASRDLLAQLSSGTPTP